MRWFRETNRVPAKEFLLNLNPDFVHPSFGTVCPVLKKPDLRLKLLYPLFGGSELRRYFVSRLKGPLVVCLRCMACPWHLACPPSATLLLPSPLTQGQPNPPPEDIMNLAPFAKGRPAKPLIEGLREIEGGVDYAGPPLSALGLCWCAGSGPEGSGALGHESLSYGLPRA